MVEDYVGSLQFPRDLFLFCGPTETGLYEV